MNLSNARTDLQNLKTGGKLRPSTPFLCHRPAQNCENARDYTESQRLYRVAATQLQNPRKKRTSNFEVLFDSFKCKYVSPLFACAGSNRPLETLRPIPHYTKSCLKSHFSGTFQASCHGDHFEKRAKVKSACWLQSNTSTLFQGNFLPFQDTFLTFLQPFDFFPNVFPVVSFSCGELWAVNNA